MSYVRAWSVCQRKSVEASATLNAPHAPYSQRFTLYALTLVRLAVASYFGLAEIRRHAVRAGPISGTPFAALTVDGSPSHSYIEGPTVHARMDSSLNSAIQRRTRGRGNVEREALGVRCVWSIERRGGFYALTAATLPRSHVTHPESPSADFVSAQQR